MIFGEKLYQLRTERGMSQEMLARTMKRVRERDEKTANRLLRRDILMVCIVCFLPNALRWIPGNWEVFLAQMAMVPPLQKTWKELRLLYGLPWKERNKKN